MPVRGIRGATTAASNTPDDIHAATRELLVALIAANDLVEGDVASVIFTATPDLDAAFPATAARQIGWTSAALLDAVAPAVTQGVTGLPRCVRVLVHWNTDRPQSEVRHVYLGGARALRPDR
jgi:chorismate mutase